MIRWIVIENIGMRDEWKERLLELKSIWGAIWKFRAVKISYIKMIQLNLQFMRGGSPSSHLAPNKAFSAMTWFHSIELLKKKRSNKNSQTPQAVALTVLYAGHHWKRTHTKSSLNMEIWVGAYMEPSLLCFSLFAAGRYFRASQNEK